MSKKNHLTRRAKKLTLLNAEIKSLKEQKYEPSFFSSMRNYASGALASAGNMLKRAGSVVADTTAAILPSKDQITLQTLLPLLIGILPKVDAATLCGYLKSAPGSIFNHLKHEADFSRGCLPEDLLRACGTTPIPDPQIPFGKKIFEVFLSSQQSTNIFSVAEIDEHFISNATWAVMNCIRDSVDEKNQKWSNHFIVALAVVFPLLVLFICYKLYERNIRNCLRGRPEEIAEQPHHIELQEIGVQEEKEEKYDQHQNQFWLDSLEKRVKKISTDMQQLEAKAENSELKEVQKLIDDLQNDESIHDTIMQELFTHPMLCEILAEKPFEKNYEKHTYRHLPYNNQGLVLDAYTRLPLRIVKKLNNDLKTKIETKLTEIEIAIGKIEESLKNKAQTPVPAPAHF